jgi:glycosyltransferase involved in cell wall biosynthesis
MKVLLVYGGLRFGGIRVDVRNLEGGLRSRGVDVSVAGDLAEARRQMRGEDVLVHVFSCLPSATNFGAMALARARRLPLVWTPVFHPHRLETWNGSGALKVMEAFDRAAPRAASLTDGVIAGTEAEEEYFRRLGAPRVEIIPPAVDKTIARASGEARASARAEFGLADEPTVLLVGRAKRRKGFPFAVEVMRALWRRLPEARLLVVGPHAPDSKIARAPGTIVPGFCSPERLDAAYDAAHALLVPARYEQFSRAVIEAWARELPPVVTDGVGLAPLVGKGAGLVAPWGDAAAVAKALAEIITNPQLARGYGTAGRTLVEERFLVSDHVERTMAFYNAVRAAR